MKNKIRGKDIFPLILFTGSGGSCLNPVVEINGHVYLNFTIVFDIILIIGHLFTY